MNVSLPKEACLKVLGDVLPLLTELPRRVLLGNQASAKSRSRKPGFQHTQFSETAQEGRDVTHSASPLSDNKRASLRQRGGAEPRLRYPECSRKL